MLLSSLYNTQQPNSPTNPLNRLVAYNLSIQEDFLAFEAFSSLLKEIKLDSLMTDDEKFCFWINIYHTILLHSIVKLGLPYNGFEKLLFFSKAKYIIDHYEFSLTFIEKYIFGIDIFLSKHFIRYDLDTSDERLKFKISQFDKSILLLMNLGSSQCSSIVIYKLDSFEQKKSETIIKSLENNVKVYLNSSKLMYSELLHWIFEDVPNIPKILLELLPQEHYLKKDLSQIVNIPKAPSVTVPFLWDFKINFN